MPSENLTVSNLYLNMVAGYLHSQQLDISFPDITLNESACVSTRLPLQTLLNFIEHIINKTGNKAIGLDIGCRVHLSDYGIMGHAAMSAASLKEGVELMCKYKHLLNESFQPRILTSGETSIIQLNTNYNPQEIIPLVELEFASAVRLGKIVSGPINCHKVMAKEIRFVHAPQTHKQKYLDLFKCPVKFNQNNNEIVVDTRVLNTSVYSPDPSLYNMVMRRMEELSANMPSHSPLHVRIFNHVFSVMMNSSIAVMPSAEDTARHFNMSLSTLKKHLKQDDTNYTFICDEVRKKITINLMGQRELKLKAIYHQLGFSSASTFNRAFRRWMDMSPSQYKANLNRL